MNEQDAFELAYKNGYDKGRADALKEHERERAPKKLSPKCCEKCDRMDENGACLYGFRNCPRWRGWFKKAWKQVRDALRDPDKKEEPKQ